MKYVFNAIILIVVIIVIRMAACHDKPGSASDIYSPMDKASGFDGARLIKTCKHYFKNPSSVALDKENDVVYVSNVVSSQTDKDSLGYLCKASIYGEIIDTLNLKCNSPRGMAVSNGFLYVADIDKLLKYSISGDSLTRIFGVRKAMLLKDVTVDNTGNIYVTDFLDSKIYRLSNDSLTLFCADSVCANPGGICMDGTSLIVGAKNSIVKVDETGAAKLYKKLSFSPEGIMADGKGNYIVSDFKGGIYAISPESSETLVKKRANINCADFEYIPEQSLLIVPTYYDNSLEVYELGSYLNKDENSD